MKIINYPQPNTVFRDLEVPYKIELGNREGLLRQVGFFCLEHDEEKDEVRMRIYQNKPAHKTNPLFIDAKNYHYLVVLLGRGYTIRADVHVKTDIDGRLTHAVVRPHNMSLMIDLFMVLAVKHKV